MTAKRPNSSDKIVHAVGEDARIPASTPESTPGRCETATRDATTCAITNTERERLKRGNLTPSQSERTTPRPFPSPSPLVLEASIALRLPSRPHTGPRGETVRVRVRDGPVFFTVFLSLSFVTFVFFLVLAILPYPKVSWLSVSLFSGLFPNLKVKVSVSSGQVRSNLPYCSL